MSKSVELGGIEVHDGGDKRYNYVQNGKNVDYAAQEKKTAKSHNYATEDVLRRNYEKEVKANPGMESAIKGKYRKY